MRLRNLVATINKGPTIMRINNNARFLIHALFRYAKVRNTKVHMDRDTYRRFVSKSTFKAFDGEIINTADYTVDLVCHDYKESCEKRHLILSHSSIYGGYVVERFHNDSGAIDHPLNTGCERFDANTLRMLLSAYVNGYESAEAEHGISWGEEA